MVYLISGSVEVITKLISTTTVGGTNILDDALGHLCGTVCHAFEACMNQGVKYISVVVVLDFAL